MSDKHSANSKDQDETESLHIEIPHEWKRKIDKDERFNYEVIISALEREFATPGSDETDREVQELIRELDVQFTELKRQLDVFQDNMAELGRLLNEQRMTATEVSDD